MPYKSQAQAGYFHTHEAELEKQGVDISEWDHATKGKHLPKRVGYAKGGPVDAEYAKGGAARAGDTRWTKKDPQGRSEYGKFLGTENRFTGDKPPPAVKTDEDWTKSKGVGQTDTDDQGDSKSLKPVKPRT